MSVDCNEVLMYGIAMPRDEWKKVLAANDWEPRFDDHVEGVAFQTGCIFQDMGSYYSGDITTVIGPRFALGETFEPEKGEGFDETLAALLAAVKAAGIPAVVRWHQGVLWS